MKAMFYRGGDRGCFISSSAKHKVSLPSRTFPLPLALPALLCLITPLDKAYLPSAHHHEVSSHLYLAAKLHSL